jgi:uncharacterized protein YjbI with pentapeptide repeats
MANKQHLDRLVQGVKKWNQWREKHPAIKPDLSKADLSGVNLSEANLSGADLSGTNLDATDLSNANLVMTNLNEADLSEANLSGADLSAAILRQATFNRTILNRTIFTAANLSGVDLSGVYLSEVNFKSTDLSEANLSGAYLSEADLSEADLSKANLSEADLSKANLTGVDLSEADLSEADLSEADLSGAILNGANLSQASIGRTIFGYVDLSMVKGLETIFHIGPSTIGIDTIYRSQGLIPKVFLQGAGIPERFVNYMQSLVSESINFCSCFISHSSKDRDFAERLYADLQNKGVRCWFAPEDMKIGDRIRVRIDESIHIFDKLLLVLSQHSVASEWVEYEVETALDKESEGKQTVLFPIRLDESILNSSKGWAALIRRTRHIGNFENWKSHDDYQKALNRLLRDLKAEV